METTGKMIEIGTMADEELDALLGINPFEALFDGPPASTAPAPTVHATTTKAEVCGKCRGRGIVTFGRRNLTQGTCYWCKGTGRLEVGGTARRQTASRNWRKLVCPACVAGGCPCDKHAIA